MNKKYIFIFLSSIISSYFLFAQENTQLSSADDRRVILYNQYKNGQKIISTDKNADITLLQEHMKQLQEQKKEYDSFCQRNIVPYAKVGKFIFMNVLCFVTGVGITHIYHWDGALSLPKGSRLIIDVLWNKSKYPVDKVQEAKDTLFRAIMDIVICSSGIVGLHIISQRNAKTQKLLIKINKLIERDQAIIEQLSEK